MPDTTSTSASTSPRGLPRKPSSSFASLRVASARSHGVGRERRQQRDAVREQLREHAPGADHQYLPELRIEDQADEDFRDAIDDHFLDEQRIGQAAQSLRRFGRLRGAPQIERDPAHLGLVLQMGTDRLEDHRIAQRLCAASCLGRRHHVAAGDRDAVACQGGLAFGLGKAIHVGCLCRAGAGARRKPELDAGTRAPRDAHWAAAAMASSASRWPCSGTIPPSKQHLRTRALNGLGERGNERARDGAPCDARMYAAMAASNDDASALPSGGKSSMKPTASYPARIALVNTRSSAGGSNHR